MERNNETRQGHLAFLVKTAGSYRDRTGDRGNHQSWIEIGGGCAADRGEYRQAAGVAAQAVSAHGAAQSLAGRSVCLRRLGSSVSDWLSPHCLREPIFGTFDRSSYFQMQKGFSLTRTV